MSSNISYVCTFNQITYRIKNCLKILVSKYKLGYLSTIRLRHKKWNFYPRFKQQWQRVPIFYHQIFITNNQFWMLYSIMSKTLWWNSNRKLPLDETKLYFDDLFVCLFHGSLTSPIMIDRHVMEIFIRLSHFKYRSYITCNIGIDLSPLFKLKVKDLLLCDISHPPFYL